MQKEAQQRSRWPGRVRLLVMRIQAAFERIVDQDSGTWGFKTRVASLETGFYLSI